jgi:flagellar biosynthesis/type III secretory pathway protein FliH
MNMSKLVKSSAVILDSSAYMLPVTRPEIHEDIIDEADAAEELPEDEIESEDIPEKERKAAVNEEIKAKREEIDKEALKNFAHEIISEHSSQTQGRTSELVGEEIITQAQRTAELIINHTLESAKFELTNVIAQAYADGFAEGKAEALSVIEPALGKLAGLTEAVANIQDMMLDNFKDGIFSIISEISSKIIHREISAGDEYLLELYKDALKSIKAEEFVTVTVGESQIDFAVRNADIFKEAVSHIQDFRIIAEKDAKPGTMIVETAKSIADASYYIQEEKIDVILQQLKDTLIIPQSAEEIEELEKNEKYT